MQTSRLIETVFVAVSLSLVGAARVDSAETTTRSRRADSVGADVSALIEKLGASEFVDREAASQQILQLGLAALEPLEDAAHDPNPEIRFRARRLLAMVRDNDRRRRIAAFAADSEGKHDYKLAGWKRYRGLVGDDAQARDLFVQMQRAEWALLEAAEADPKSAGGLFALRCQQLQQRLSKQGRPVPLGSVATLLFVASDERVAVPGQTDVLIYSFCYSNRYGGFSDAAKSGGKKAVLGKLLGNWLAGGRGGYYGVRLAMQYGLPEGLVPAKKLLQGGGVPTSYKQYTLLAFAKLGTKEDIPFLEKKLSDATVLYTRTDSKTKKVLYQIQVRDVVLAVLLHLSKQDPKKYGFDRIAAHPETVFQTQSTSFPNDAVRNAALEKWKEFHGRKNG